MSTLTDLFTGAAGRAPLPVTVALLVLLVAVVGALARWLAGSLWRSLRAALTRQGERIGALEHDVDGLRADARLEGIRRFQLEATLLRRGFDLPPWPDSPHVDVDEDQADEDDPPPGTTWMPTQHFTRHHLDGRTTP